MRFCDKIASAMRRFFTLILCMFVCPVFADDVADLVQAANQVVEATRIVCGGISDEIGRVANISKANTAVAAIGTGAAGGALAAGIKKSQEDAEIEELINQICESGGCTPEGVAAMSNEQFFENVIKPMAQIAELQEKLDRSKKLGNWRTGLMAGTIGTNLATAIMSGLNINQSDLVQQISACNEMIKTVSDMQYNLKLSGVSPIDNPVVRKLDNIKTWCGQIDLNDIEKIEKRMKGVMGTSIAGTAIGVVGVGTSAAANSEKYTDASSKLSLTDQERNKERALNTTANVMAGANVATGVVETGLSISLISLTKRLMAQSGRCEEILK